MIVGNLLGLGSSSRQGGSRVLPAMSRDNLWSRPAVGRSLNRIIGSKNLGISVLSNNKTGGKITRKRGGRLVTSGKQFIRIAGAADIQSAKGV